MPDLRPSRGLVVLHLFARVAPGTDGSALRLVLKAAASADSDPAPGSSPGREPSPAVQVVTFSVLGHKADFGVMLLGPELWRLRSLQTEIAGCGVNIVQSYVSLTEVSEYAQGLPEAMLQSRLYPELPPAGKTAFCFYPMSKRRQVGANWYEQPYEERERLMRAHGTTGRTFAGRVVQLITGSTGLDEFEWGVTLFAVGPDDLKEVVYKMRYDEASAHYAEFGPFYVGAVASVDEVLASVGLVS